MSSNIFIIIGVGILYIIDNIAKKKFYYILIYINVYIFRKIIILFEHYYITKNIITKSI